MSKKRMEAYMTDMCKMAFSLFIQLEMHSTQRYTCIQNTLVIEEN